MDTNITTEQLIALSSILSTLTVQDVEAINAAPVESLTSVELFVKVRFHAVLSFAIKMRHVLLHNTSPLAITIAV